MLKYQLSKQVFGNDTIPVQYNEINYQDYPNEANDEVLVELECEDASFVNNGNILTFSGVYSFYDPIINNFVKFSDGGSIPVYAVNYLTNSIYFLDSRYTDLEVNAISVDIKDGIVTWIFYFADTHFYDERGNGELYIRHKNGLELHIYGNPIIYNQMTWTFDVMTENAQEMSDLIFGPIDPTIDTQIDGYIDDLSIFRPQARWSTFSQSGDQLSIGVNQYRVSLNIPIAMKSKADLYSEGNIKEYFVDYEEQKSINAPTEMEKYTYTPVTVVKKNNVWVFEDCVKINFNLHFRAHDGDDWTVNNSDSWNFEKYGDYNDWLTNKYYSYTPSPTSNNPLNQRKRSCQSDLLSYLGFVTNDVKYQKNKLKKSFLRLFYYDSNNPATQNLLGYSTVFMDCNKLYSKFISKANFECYYDDNGNIVKGIKADREVSVNDLTRILNWRGMTTEEIEDYRLSSQFSVKNKYLSDNSSEGFYLYKWEGEGEAVVPNDVYLKVEFNHAGYGRNVPMMAPYKDGQEKGFKTNGDIISDWSNTATQYGIKKYIRYSYIHLKTKYDTNTNRRIYYLDPDTYGPSQDGNIININLYEARIAFND